ncbi:glutathione S-transferase family protein [Qipengyuania psychrotolerans]|uniref:Glutathione S-transferase family protein n=1 Tax=Qipengyuania psychrotolerans TaxID=2867238 RepID=A0ABX8ZB17_9SPHN|nr:glutathione S-transferase family protein [Qipengyuania psychrotolerans]QZD86162.1 glutathione S-transferase family protein [Qipengyuania psychrotolerans]
MLFYDSPNPAPNPRRVRIFAAEKGIELPMQEVSIPKREQKAPDFVAKNPRGQTPILELDDGTIIAESVAIMRYLEAVHPETPLFGTSPREIAEIEMWSRRAEMILMAPVGAVWVHTHPFTAALPGRNADWGETNLPRVAEAFRFFDGALADRDYLAGDSFTAADILLLTTADFATFVGCGMPEDCENLRGWHERVSARPSTQA